MSMKSEYKNISPCKAIKFLQLSPDELKALHLIRQLPPTDEKELRDILLTYCNNVAFFVRLAIYSPQVREWCRQNLTQTWEKALKELSQGMTLNYQFQPQKKLSTFDLVAGLILMNESFLCEEQSDKETVFLFLAMDIFNSSHAAYFIADRALTKLQIQREEKVITSMSKILERISAIHGSPGYLIFSFFTYQLAEFFLQNGSQKRAAGALHLCYQFLLTASKLEKHCAAELLNFSCGSGQTLLKKLNKFLNIDKEPREIPFISLMDFYKKNYSTFIAPIEKAAEQASHQLAARW